MGREGLLKVYMISVESNGCGCATLAQTRLPDGGQAWLFGYMLAYMEYAPPDPVPVSGRGGRARNGPDKDLSGRTSGRRPIVGKRFEHRNRNPFT